MKLNNTSHEENTEQNWNMTPKDNFGGETPKSINSEETTPSKKTSRWDQTPVELNDSNTGRFGATPTLDQIQKGNMTPKQYKEAKFMAQIEERNKELSDEDLDNILPQKGYIILEVPKNYKPIREKARKYNSTPTPLSVEPYYKIPNESTGSMESEIMSTDLPNIKVEDMKHFGKLLEEVDENELTKEELREREIMKLILQIKNGEPKQRKKGLRNLTAKARIYGAGPLFNIILPLLMSPTLDDQERHLLVKVIDRILFKLQELVRPYVHNILVVIEPLLIDEDYYAKIEGREIISNLSKAAGLQTMIATLRPDLDNSDEYVRNATARAFSVVASSLGINSLLPFLKAVCLSKKSWTARHTGIKIVQQIAILMGCGVLPHLKQMVEIIKNGFIDTEPKIQIITALAISSLAEASHPYGIESFDIVLQPLWEGIQKFKGKILASYLKAIGCLIPLMSPEDASIYTKHIINIVIREFENPQTEMQKIILKVVKQLVSTNGIESKFIKQKIIEPYFKNFFTYKLSMDKRSYKQIIETTVEVGNKVGSYDILVKIIDELKSEKEQFRKMTLEIVQKIIELLGVDDINEKLEIQLFDGLLHCFSIQFNEEKLDEEYSRIMLNCFGTVINSLKNRMKPYLPKIAGLIKLNLNNKFPKLRQNSADLLSKISETIYNFGDGEVILLYLSQILYEYLSEEYPDVLSSIINALKSIINVVGLEKMTPPIKDLLPRLTPILKNRNDKVQDACIQIVGKIAQRGPEYVHPKEWMRICFELLELLKSHKKSVRRAAILTFGYISKSIGPFDVLTTLLNNLRVQERQNRVCTTIAIAIVAENCFPFTVLPALLNEYKVPEMNVQNGVLKSLAFLFEYIGDMSRDYINSCVTILEDALMDRDQVIILFKTRYTDKSQWPQ
jgi:splicing factor 3B subunit 1